MRPLPDDNEQVMRYAETFVEETKPEEKDPESENQTSEKRNERDVERRLITAFKII